MPSYDFKCDTCSSVIEVQRSFDEEGTPTCIPCNKTMTRMWQATPAHFKGGGWGGKDYNEDY
jgi:hypothetical protein